MMKELSLQQTPTTKLSTCAPLTASLSDKQEPSHTARAAKAKARLFTEGL